MVVIRADLVSLEDDGVSRIRYSIIDNGIGIAKDAQDKLFEAFTQAESSTTRRYGGTGLGLSICRKLVEIMGGEIGVESEPGLGSTFWVELLHEPAKRQSAMPEASDLADVRVLVASGLEEFREFIPSYLRHWHAEVDVLANAEDVHSRVVANAGDRPYDAVMLAPDIDSNTQTSMRDAARESNDSGRTKFILMGQGRRFNPRVVSDDTVFVDAIPLRRTSMVAAVAIAVGRASPELKPEEDTPTHEREVAPTVQKAERQGQLILVAEDNLTNQDVILRQLNVLGYAADVVENGKQALEAWKHKNYAVLCR